MSSCYLVGGVERYFTQYFSYIVAVSFLVGGNRNTRRNHRSTKMYDKLHANFITECCIKFTSPWAGFELITLLVICTNYIGSCKANYQPITAHLTLKITVFEYLLVSNPLMMKIHIQIQYCNLYFNELSPN